MRPTIAILYVGGSIGMVANKRTGRIEPIESLGEIHRALPDVQREVKLEFHSIANVGSSEVTPEHWVELVQKIQDLYEHVDGFVVIHGTNTMSYTAAALSFALQNLSKPVILTGALIPINDIASDGRMNLVFAIRAAQLDIAEVCIVLGSRVLRGNRAKKVEQSFLQSFDSPLFPPLAEFNLDVHLHPWHVVRRKRRPKFRPTFDTSVTSVTFHPGMPMITLEKILDTHPHGIVIRAYGLGMLPAELFPWLRRAKEEGVSIVVTSQMTRGQIDLHRYRKQITLEKLGIISGKNMTYEAAVTKLMWVLGQTQNERRIREMMERNLVGELDE